MHPTGELGDVLFADYLVHYMSQAEQALFGEGAPGAGRPCGAPGEGCSGGGGSACGACPAPLPGGSELPAAPLYAGGRDVYWMRCYGSPSADVSGRRPRAPTA